jgi:molybdenum cofactor biosynthesis enzyme MoaA
VENESNTKMKCTIDAVKEIRKISSAKIHINTVILKTSWAKVAPLLEFAKSVEGVAKFIELFDLNVNSSPELSSGDPGETLGKLLEVHGWTQLGDSGGSGSSGSKRTTTFCNKSANSCCTARIDKLSCAVVKETGGSCGGLMPLAITRQGMLKTCFMKNANMNLYPSINERDEKKLGELLLEGLAQIGKNCPLNNVSTDIEDLI